MCGVLLIVLSYVLPSSLTYRAIVTGVVVAFCLLWLYQTTTNLDRMTEARDDAVKWANELENMLLTTMKSANSLQAAANELADELTEWVGRARLSLAGWKEATGVSEELLAQARQAAGLGNQAAELLKMNMPLLEQVKQDLQLRVTELEQKPKFAELVKQHNELTERVASMELLWKETQARVSGISELHVYRGNEQREPSADLTIVKETYHRAKLRKNLTECFSKSELRALCFDLEIKDENLAADTLDGMAMELVAYCERTGRVPELVEKCKGLRPKAVW
jgi:hypothetical protein